MDLNNYQIEINQRDEIGNRVAQIEFRQQPETQQHNARMVDYRNLCYAHLLLLLLLSSPRFLLLL